MEDVPDPSDPVEGLMRMMHQEWHWSVSEVEKQLPRLVAILSRVGIIAKSPDGKWFSTELSLDHDAWDVAWAEFQKEDSPDSSDAS